MATIKAVSSHAGIAAVIDYVSKEEKTDEKLISGLNCQPDTAKDEMQTTKELYGKTGGRTYKHFVQSFHKDEKITADEAHSLAKAFAERCLQFKGFEVLIATHKDREHIHTHFILNSVSFEDGHKFRMHKSELQDMKDLSDELCREHELHVCEKGKTFDGEEREEMVAYKKDTYQILKQAENGEVKSYVQDIALAIMDIREIATSRQEFVELLAERGINVDWQDNHKYITFTDLAREQAGDAKCKIRNNKLEKYYNIDFGKEGLEHGFEENARSREIETRAREQLERFNQTANGENRGAGRASSERLLQDAGDGIIAARATERNREANSEQAREQRQQQQSNKRRYKERGD